jgi:GDPmannose 4,6-dehydratase
MRKTALITGVTGQDGSYLAELLLSKNYRVVGLQRYKSSQNLENLKQINNTNFELLNCDITDYSSIFSIIKNKRPAEIYNLAAQSHVKISFDNPDVTTQINSLGVLRILEAIRNTDKKIKFYQASSSEMFGKVQETPQNEKTPFYPRSPYGVSKLYSYWITKNYRESYNIFAVNGILFNHESERRGENFVTKKIIKSLVEILYGKKKVLKIGNLNARRDWGYAPEYVEGMWKMLQQDTPDDYVLATNETHSIKELINETCKYLNIDLKFSGEGIDEKGYWGSKKIIEIDREYFRPAEVDLLQGDYSHARKKLGWEPKTKFKDLIKIMSDYEIKNIDL